MWAPRLAIQASEGQFWRLGVSTLSSGMAAFYKKCETFVNFAFGDLRGRLAAWLAPGWLQLWNFART